MNRTYLVVFEKGKECWGAFAPDIPGTGGMGDTFEEARERLREGIGYMLEDALERGLDLPAAATGIDFAEYGPLEPGSHFEIEWLTVTLPTRHRTIEDENAHAA